MLLALRALQGTLNTDGVVFAVALLASLLLTAPVRRFAVSVGLVDEPGPRKVHRTPIPLLGGLAIYFGFVLALIFGVHTASRAQMIGIVAGATLVAAVGFLDDAGLLHHQIKLFVAMPLAAVILLASGIRADFFAAILSGSFGTALDTCLTIVWVVGITAAFSILDHMDGLCAGIAALASVFFALTAALDGQLLVRALAVAAVGAALGFLCWNFSPAKIFMGDGGAMFLGFLMAVLGLKVHAAQRHTLAGWILPVLILGVPIFDTTLITISRSRRRLLPFASPGKDHTAHRLSNLGLGQRGAVLVLYGLGCLFGILGQVIARRSPGQVQILLVSLVAAGAIAIYFLEKAPYERQGKIERSQSLP